MALLFTVLDNFRYRGQYHVDSTDVSDAEWDAIEAALSLSFFELTNAYICPPGGGGDDYTLQNDITLLSDATTYTLTGLASLTGRDLRIEITAATTHTGRRDLRYEINGLTTDKYGMRYQYFLTSATFIDTEKTNGEIDNILPQTQTPQTIWGYIEMNFIDWKNSDEFSQGNFQGYGEVASFVGHTVHREAVEMDTFKIWAGTGDLKAGSQIRVYTRG